MIKIILLFTIVFFSGCIVPTGRSMVAHRFNVPVKGDIDFSSYKVMCMFRGGYKKELKLKEKRKNMYIFSGSEYIKGSGGWIFYLFPDIEFDLSGDA